MSKWPIAVNHPEFKYLTRLGDSGWHGAPKGLRQPHVAVFERSVWSEPSKEQLADYRRKREIVEAHDGRMRYQEWECAGSNVPFTEQDVAEMISAVAANKHVRIVDTWNGKGVFAFSVGFECPIPPAAKESA